LPAGGSGLDDGLDVATVVRCLRDARMDGTQRHLLHCSSLCCIKHGY